MGKSKRLNYYLETLLKNKKLPLKIIEHFSPYELAKEYLFMGLRLKEGISLRSLKKNYGYFLPQDILNILLKEDLINKKKERIYLTFKGKLLHNKIVSFLWDKLCN